MYSRIEDREDQHFNQAIKKERKEKRYTKKEREIKTWVGADKGNLKK